LEQPAACVTTDWVLAQFSRKRSKAEKEYRQFVAWGVGKDTIWQVESLLPHIKKGHDIPDIPKEHLSILGSGLYCLTFVGFSDSLPPWLAHSA